MLRFYEEVYISFINARFTYKTDSQNNVATVVLVSCLKQVTDLILDLLVSGSFFSEKKNYKLYYNTGFFSVRWMCR